MKKLTFQEWNKLSREEKAKAILEFREPEHLYRPEWIDKRKLQQEKI